MKELQQILTTFDDWLWGNWLLFVLLGVGLLYTIITGGIQIRRFGYIIRKTIWEPILSKSKESKEAGTISSFQALCTAVASCVGSGNIVHSRAGRRHGSYLLDVGGCLCGNGYQIRRDHTGYAVP